MSPHDPRRAILMRISDHGDCDIRLHRLTLARVFDRLGDARASDAIACQDVNFFHVPARVLEALITASQRMELLSSAA